MRLVLDATAFFLDIPLEGELYTTPSVVAELADLASKCRFEALLARGLRVQEPGRERREEVEKAASASGIPGFSRRRTAISSPSPWRSRPQSQPTILRSRTSPSA